MPSVKSQGIFNPTMLESEPLGVSVEQKTLIRAILDVASSDDQFAAKAYDAIVFILTSGSVVAPEITSLNPNTAELGSPSFTIHVLGSNFTPASVILWSGSPETTTFISSTELTTEVDMSTAQAAVDISVQVENLNGVISDSSIFSLTAAPELLRAKSKSKSESKAKSKDEEDSMESFSSFHKSKK